jgi:hypothetical protein
MATVTNTKPTKTPLCHRASTTSTKSMAENVKKIAITTDNKLPLLRGIDQVCSKIQKTKYLKINALKDIIAEPYIILMALITSQLMIKTTSNSYNTCFLDIYYII